MTESRQDERYMTLALDAARSVRRTASPNPWVGAVLVSVHDEVYVGATQADHGPHAEAQALASAGDAARGGTLYVTLEPCNHAGRNPPCTEAIIRSGISRVVVATVDPDARMRGASIGRLRSEGVEVTTGVCEDEAQSLLAPYLKQRLTGRPYVVLKMAMTLDGKSAAADGTSKWITSEAAREDVHRIRAESDVIVIGAGTVRADDPSLTVRIGDQSAKRQPERIVLGAIRPEAKVNPARSWTDSIESLLSQLGAEGVLQVMVEGGASVAGEFHRRHLIDQYVVYLAPALLGGSEGVGLMSGPSIGTMADAWRGDLVDVEQLGPDVRLTIQPRHDGYRDSFEERPND